MGGRGKTVVPAQHAHVTKHCGVPARAGVADPYGNGRDVRARPGRRAHSAGWAGYRPGLGALVGAIWMRRAFSLSRSEGVLSVLFKRRSEDVGVAGRDAYSFVLTGLARLA